MTFLGLLRREWKAVCSWKSPFFYLLVGLPLLYTFLFGAIYSQGVVESIPLVICDQDNSAVSRAVINAYGASDRFRIIAQVQTIDELETTISSGEALSGVYIPPHFAKDIKTRVPTSIGIFVDSTNLVYGNGQMPVHNELTTSILVGIRSQIAEGLGIPPSQAFDIVYPVHMNLRIMANPTNSYNNFMLLGLVANALQVGIFLMASTLLCREYCRINRLRRVNSLTFIGVRFLGTWVTSLVTAVLVFLISHYVYAVPMRASVAAFAILTMAFTFLFTSICFFFSALLPNAVLASQIPMIYVMPGLLYSGMSWPHQWMSKWATAFSSLMPLTYYGEPLRDLSLLGYAINYWSDVMHMVIAGIICLILTCLIFIWQRKRHERNHPFVMAHLDHMAEVAHKRQAKKGKEVKL